MATVAATGDTFEVLLTDKETRALARIASEAQATPEDAIEKTLTDWLSDAQTDFLNADGPTRLRKFAALPLATQDAVDTLLTGE